MGKREMRRKYKDVDARNLGVNQTLEHKNSNIITEKELIIIIILKLLSEKLKQSDSIINKDLQTKRKKLYDNRLGNREKPSKDTTLDSVGTNTKDDEMEDDKKQEVIIIVEEKVNLVEGNLKEVVDFPKDNVVDVNPPEEKIDDELKDTIPNNYDIQEHTTEKLKENIKDIKENVYMNEDKYKNSESTITYKSKTTVENTTVLRCCKSEDIKSGFLLKDAVVKIPVVLSEIEVPIFIVATEEFKEPILKIMSLDKKVVLKRCQLVTGTNKLFIKGVVEEEIEYSTVNYSDKDSVNGEIKKVSLNIPFKCSTEVSFVTKPILNNNSYLFNIESLIEDINDKSTYERCNEDLDHFSEIVFCNLKSSRIIEVNNKQYNKVSEDVLKDIDTFKCISKKIILFLKITLLQNQEVFNYNKNKVQTD